MAKCEPVTTLGKTFLIRGRFAGTVGAAPTHDPEKRIQRTIGIPVP